MDGFIVVVECSILASIAGGSLQLAVPLPFPNCNYEKETMRATFSLI